MVLGRQDLDMQYKSKNMQKLKVVHIGMPKNLSTTLQRDFFDKHPQIYHLGIGVNNNVGYKTNMISAACENYFIYSNLYSYNKVKNKIKNGFNEEFKNFLKINEKRVLSLSLELLSFTFTSDHNDINEKAKRLKEYFDENTKIIIIIRNQLKLIESLFREAIKIGYNKEFKDYINYLYLLRDRNFIYDLDYFNTYTIYSKLFKSENIFVLPIEDYRHSNGLLKYNNNNECLLTKKISEILNIEHKINYMNHYNETLSDSILNELSKLNKKISYGIGGNLYSKGANFHRLKDYYELNNIQLNNDDLFENVITKNNNIKIAKLIKKENSKIQYNYSDHILKFFKNVYYPSNEKLFNIIEGKNISSYFNFNL